MPKKKEQSSFQNRIVGHGVKAAADFTLNPNNWRRHPEAQQTALRKVLSSIGWVTGVIENVTTGHLIDGHSRVEESLKNNPQTPVPFLKVELTETEEKQILLLLDPIGAMAETDDEAIRALMASVDIDDADLLAVLESIAEIEPIDTGDPNLNDPNFNYESQFGVIVSCKDENHQRQVYEDLSRSGYEVKVVVV